MTDHSQKNEPEKKRSELFEEDNGNVSSIRLMSLIALIAAIIFGFLTILLEDANATNGIYITFGFLLSAFAPKALQKFAETKVK
ncbi:MAG: hypothetical protein HF982_13725 [Desulfobacteraceae bacterium]|nr:hypothetical protein [Desulfobacteraceae bacterium]MBC2720618.1 hypothetical protein [Desulfobacteraceae bacterium]